MIRRGVGWEILPFKMNQAHHLLRRILPKTFQVESDKINHNIEVINNLETSTKL